MPDGFFSSLKQVAVSPYALIAYLVIAGGWVFISFRSLRLKYISKAIKDIPDKDRKDLLMQEYGIYLKQGMTAQEYLKARRQTYSFVIVVCTLLMVTVIVAISLVQSNAARKTVAASTVDPAFCLAVDSIANNILTGYVPLRAGVKPHNDPGETDYYSKLTIPGTKYNSIDVSADDTMYFASLYDGGDKTLAYNAYLKFTQQVAKCKDDWVFVPALKGDTTGLLEYTSFVHEDVKIAVTFNLNQDSSYAATMIFVKNGKDPK